MKLTLLEDLLDLFYPACCAGCDSPLVGGEDIICVQCQLELPHTNFHEIPNNPIDRLFTGRVPIEKSAAFLHFVKNGIVQNLLHKLKYKNQPQLGVLLGKLAGYHLSKKRFFDHIDCILPIPLHPKKLKKRGYNQSEMIVKGLAAATALPYHLNILKRVMYNDTQTRKARFDRWLNVETIFGLDNGSLLSNKHILLVDDVITTGSTLESAVTKLLQLNGAKVSIFVLARA